MRLLRRKLGTRMLGAVTTVLWALLATNLTGGPTYDRSADVVAQARRQTLTPAQLANAYGKLPLSFEANNGQTDPRVKFLSRGAGYTLFLTPHEAVLSLRQRGGHPQGTGANVDATRRRGATVRMHLVGANPNPRMVGVTRVPGTSNYLIGTKANAWHTGVPSFAGAMYRGIYRGVDLVYHGRQGRLEYDLRVAPGGDPRQVAIDFSGTRKPSLDRQGNLVLRTPDGVLRQQKPVIYQEVDGARRSVRGRFAVRGRRVGFRVGKYDRSRPLVIDPVLAYSTYLGGSGGDRGSAIAVDGSGNAYVAGFSGSADFPTSDASYQTTRTGDPADIFDRDAFVTKLSPSGKLVYSTFLGGAGGDDAANGIAVDSSGRAYVAGDTRSQAFPTTSGAFQPKAPPSYQNAFVSVLKADGSGLVYSSYLGGSSGNESAQGVAVDGSGRAYVTGSTRSAGFPSKGTGDPPLQSTLNGSADAFVAKLNPDATGDDSLVYSTYLGGGEDELGAGIAVDPAGDAYVTGVTSSGDFPVAGTPAQGGAGGAGDAFVSKLNPSGSQLIFSTYLGGAGNDYASAITLDGAGHAYVTGSTSSIDFPTQDAFQSQAGSPGSSVRDAFVTELSSGGSAFEYSSYLGGTGDDQGHGIAVDPSGGAYVVGEAAGPYTTNPFPTVDPLARSAVQGDAFVARVRPGGGSLSFSSYFGGGGEDAAYAVAADSSGSAYLTGDTISTDLPTHYPLQAQSAGRGISDRNDAFVAKVAPDDPGAPLVTGVARLSGPAGTSLRISGRRFTGATGVRFGAVAADQFTVDSDTQITAIAPAQAEGPIAVTVTSASGSSPPNPIADFTYAQGLWDLTGSLDAARPGAVASRLRDGRVLVAGGGSDPYNPLGSAEMYDPADGTWQATGALVTPRQAFSATLLSDGRVLVAGGTGEAGTLDTAELYDPATKVWTATAPMAQPRVNHTATLLPDGKVLVAGGASNLNSSGTDSAELYDPATEKWSPARSMHDGRAQHTATLLANGKVLVAGGCCDANNNALASAEIYDPPADSWATTSSLISGRSEHTATRLNDGRILLAGGTSRLTTRASAEIYDVADGTFTSSGAMAHPRADAAAVLLSNGKLLVTGGNEGNSPEHNTAELYDPSSGRWGSAGVMNRYRGGLFGERVVFAVPLANGKVLVGGDVHPPGTTAELYEPNPGGSVPVPAGGSGPSSGGPQVGGGVVPVPAGAVRDVTAPVVSGFGLSNNPFVVGVRGTPVFGFAAGLSHRRGTTFRYRLSEAARARIVISRSRPGRRRAGRCVAPSRVLLHAKRCVRFVRQGVLTRMSRHGANRVAFSGRIAARALRPGRYRARLTATDAAKNTSTPKTITFTIAPR